MSLLTQPTKIQQLSAQLVIASNALITLLHLVGFLVLDWWITFSGIGNEAIQLQNRYGRLAVYLLNLSATILFLGITKFFYYSFTTSRKVILGQLIGLVFVFRGVFGFIATTVGYTGTATPGWEVMFSIWALLTGILVFIVYREELS